MTFLAFLFGIGLLVTVHEWGHYRVALACGVRVHSFSIGLGPTLFRWQVKHKRATHATEFQIGMLPLGGYVRMAHESDEGTLPADLPLTFDRQSLPSRTAIVLAGPLANWCLALCLLTSIGLLGQEQTLARLAAATPDSPLANAGWRSGDTVIRAGRAGDERVEIRSLEDLHTWVQEQDSRATLVLEVQTFVDQPLREIQVAGLGSSWDAQSDLWQARGFTGPWVRPVVGRIEPDSAAAQGGLLTGDEVLQMDDRRVTDALSLRAAIRASGASQEPATQTWRVSRHGESLTLMVTPRRVRENDGWVGRIGAQVGSPAAKVWVERDAWNSLVRAWDQTWATTAMTANTLWKVLTGQGGWTEVGGPLLVADYAGRTAQLGWAAYLSFLATLSVSLAVFNLVPLPMLDGGHLLYYLYEALTGQKPSQSWVSVAQRSGLAVLLTLMVFSLFNDVIRLGWLG